MTHAENGDDLDINLDDDGIDRGPITLIEIYLDPIANTDPVPEE